MRHSLIVAIIAIAVCIGFPCAAFAQQPEDGSADTTPSATGVAGSTPVQEGSNLLLRSADGTLRPVSELLDPSSIQEILRRTGGQINIPLFDLSQLDAVMKVRNDVVTISVDLTVTVLPESEWVAVPIGFGEVHITGFEYTGPSETAQAVPNVSDPLTKQWHLFGSGVHHIHLDLITRTRPTPVGGHQLKLSLPGATQSKVTVTFQSAVDLQQVSSDSVSQRKTDAAGVIGVEVWGPGNAFSMTWSDIAKPVAAQPAIQVQNRMQLDMTTIPILLSGNQMIQISAAPVDSLSVKMPPAFRLLELDARNQAGVSILNKLETTDHADGQVIDVSLTGMTEGQVSLVWDLELTAAPFPRDIHIQLPTVTGASLQNGDLDILIPPGLLVTQEEVSGAQRKRVAAESGGQIAATAFRVRSPESRITLRIDEIEALYAVSPELVLEPDGQNALMTVRFQLNVLRGSLLDLNFRWPGFTAGIWQILPRSARIVSANSQSALSLEQASPDTDSFSVQFPERQSGQFTVELKAFAPLDQLQSAEAALVCPEVESDSAQPAVITTIESDSFTLLPLNASTGATLNALPDRAPSESPAAPGRISTSWLLDRPSDPLRFHVNSQAPSVTASIELELIPQDYGIEVHEEIAYRIEHRDLSALSLAIPEGVRAVVHLEGEAEALRGTVEGIAVRTFRLPDPQRGDLRLVVRYLWPLTADVLSTQQAALALPIVVPQQTDISQIEVGTIALGSLQMNDRRIWQPVYSARFGTAWATETSVSSIQLTWHQGVALRPSGTPAAILGETVVVEQSMLTTTTALFEELPPAITFVLPGDLALQDVMVNDVSVREGLRAQRIENSTDVRWTLYSQQASSLIDSESATSQTAATIALKTRQLIPVKASWIDQATIHRPQFGGAAADVPVIQWVDCSESVQLIPVDDTFVRLSATSTVPLIQPRGASAIQKIEALASTQRTDLRALIMEYAETQSDGSAVVFFADSDRKSLSLFLLPAVPLLLISAVVCLLCFLVLMMTPSLRSTTFLIAGAVVLLACYAFVPSWTVIVAPYAIIGVLFGLVAVLFQRRTGDRNSRLLRSPHPQDLPTVFGFTELIRPTSTVRRRDSSVAPTASNEVPVSAT
jgi:hypothetical protein